MTDMNTDTPVIFANGSDFFERLAEKYARHARGFFILAPSGSGKTYFVDRQVTQDWIDGDYLWPATGADMSDSAWNDSHDEVIDVNNKCDVITNEARKLGFWVIGSSNNWLQPDAIVLPEWETHKKYIQQREQHNYDGGAKSVDFEGVMAHRNWIEQWKEKGVLCFESIEGAADYLNGIT